eukprot:TRINITY_DN19360_c0_g2_i2.p1 TRINITY_DN19360_c0_g2~~TRINITY_DN19360_c0_g2_i2.p1  ORF type:complete len:3287 (+),score=657.11 TRINITY_DN19360_c0_g2_i2:538-9861(+)
MTRFALSGIVRDPRNGTALEGVEVVVTASGGFTAHLETNELGTYGIVLPGGPVHLSLFKGTYVRQEKDIFLQDNVPTGSEADVWLSPLAVNVLWRLELHWTSRNGVPVDLDAHLLDNWLCHTFYGMRYCSNVDDVTGVEVTINRDARTALWGKEVISVQAWPCWPIETYKPIAADRWRGPSESFIDVRDCIAYYWVQMHSAHSFADVDAEVRVYRGEKLLMSHTLPKDNNTDHKYWAGVTLDFQSHDARPLWPARGEPSVGTPGTASFVSKGGMPASTGDAAFADAFLHGRVLPTRRLSATSSRRLASRVVSDAAAAAAAESSSAASVLPSKEAPRPAWLEGILKEGQGRKPLDAEADAELIREEARRRLAAQNGTGEGAEGRHLGAPPIGYIVNKSLDLNMSSMVFLPSANGLSFDACRQDLDPSRGIGAAALPDPPQKWARRLVLGDDSAVEIQLKGPFSFYGKRYESVFVSSNGYLTFGAPSIGWSGSSDAHFARTGISAFFLDLAPHREGDSAVWHEIIDMDGDPRDVFTFERVQHYGSYGKNTFQVTLHVATGSISMSWATLAPEASAKAVVGVAPGTFGHERETVSGSEACTSTCGNGKREGLEKCDDGNLVAFDGCAADCRVEAFYRCTVPAPGGKDVCVQSACGDGIRDSHEACDDGNTLSGDGCSDACEVEPSYACTRSNARASDVCTDVGPSPAQVFGDGSTEPFDLEGMQLLFTPRLAPSKSYTLCRSAMTDPTSLPDVPSPRATQVLLDDDDSLRVPLSWPGGFPFFGRNYSYVYISSNGFVVFDALDASRKSTFIKHFERPRISALLSDLNPAAGGTISYETVDAKGVHARFVITYEDIPQFSQTAVNSFQIALYLRDGRIRLNWASVAAAPSVVGVSPGHQPVVRSLRLALGRSVRVEPEELGTNGSSNAFYHGNFTWEAHFQWPGPALGGRTAVVSNVAEGNPATQAGLYVEASGHPSAELQDPAFGEMSLRALAALIPQRWYHLALAVQQRISCRGSPLPEIAMLKERCARAVLYVDRTRVAEYYAPIIENVTEDDEDAGARGASDDNDANALNAGNTSNVSSARDSTASTVSEGTVPYFDSGQGLVLGLAPAVAAGAGHAVGLAAARVHSRALESHELGRCGFTQLTAPAIPYMVLNLDLDGSFVDPASAIRAFVTDDGSGEAGYWYSDNVAPECTTTRAGATGGFMSDLSECSRCSGTCGNGLREGTEACDDGNTRAGDGCSPTCTLERGAFCSAPLTGGPDVCVNVTCGDGVAVGAEECDDGNLQNDDGCSSACAIEPGHACGDGGRVRSEACDDGNLRSGDGCSATCEVEPHFACSGGTARTADTCGPICGDGIKLFEACDDGNAVDGDGCSSLCEIEHGFACYGGGLNVTDISRCHPTVCGDGITEGAEECDDANDLGGDGCSAKCVIEKPPVLTADAQLFVDVWPLPQACRLANDGYHETLEDVAYGLKYTKLTGDVTNREKVSLRMKVFNGSLSVSTMIANVKKIGKTDAIPKALIEREFNLVFEPFDLLMTDTVVTGTINAIDSFLQQEVIIAPQPDFVGYMLVDFELLDGVAVRSSDQACRTEVLVRCLPNFNDLPTVVQSPELQAEGIRCDEGDQGCLFEGLGVYDPDCAQVPDGSCYVRLNVEVSVGGLTMAGRSPEPVAALPEMIGHDTGLSAALATVRYIPPGLPFGAGRAEMKVTLERVIERSTATPDLLLPAHSEEIIPIFIGQRKTPPGLRLVSGEEFHSSIFRIQGAKPFKIDTLRFEGAGGAGPSDLVAVELLVSRGGLFIGPSGDKSAPLENGTQQGEPRLKFRTNSSFAAHLLLDVRYTWDDEDCSNLEELNFTLDDGEHEPWTLSALLELPDCAAFAVSWTGDPVVLQEDTEVPLAGITLTTHEPDDVFVVVDVLHPAHVAGDCRVDIWPDDAPTFVPNRSCHLDGKVTGLSEMLPKFVYRPPPEWSGSLELEVIARRLRVEDEAIHGFASPTLHERRMVIPINVTAVNDAPRLHVEQDVQWLLEDAPSPVPLSPLFLSDVDAFDMPMLINVTLSNSTVGELRMCGLTSVTVDFPDRHVGDCLPDGLWHFHFRTTVSNFNALQWSSGRLHFLPAPNWHGALMVNVTVDDLGSGLGIAERKLSSRTIHLVVEPVLDPPSLRFTCSGAEPLTSYGHACLEVKDCFELSQAADEGTAAASLWMTISSSDPALSVSLGEAEAVRLIRDGYSSMEAYGLAEEVKASLGALHLRPPPYLFATPTSADQYDSTVNVTVRAIGQRFGEDPPSPEELLAFPASTVSFRVVFKRINRAPLIFVDTAHVSATQRHKDVAIPGISVSDPDMIPEEPMEVTFEVDADERGGYAGALVFNGSESVKLVRRLPLAALRQELMSLRFLFRDDKWFGVTGVTMTISDLGNRGVTLPEYDDYHHRETRPRVLALHGAQVTFVPKDGLAYHTLMARDFTWELYLKRLPGGNETDVATAFQNLDKVETDRARFRWVGQGWCLNAKGERIKLAGAKWTTTSIRMDYGADLCEKICDADDLCIGYMTQDLQCDVIRSTDSNAYSGIHRRDADLRTNCWVKQDNRPQSSLTIDAEGRPIVSLISEVPGGLSRDVGGIGRAHLALGQWYHLAVVVRRNVPGGETLRGRRSDSTAGDVLLFVDGLLDSSWPLHAPGVHFGPERQTHVSEGPQLEPLPARRSEFVVADGSSGFGGGLHVSRLRVWRQSLEAGDLGLCAVGGQVLPAHGVPEPLPRGEGSGHLDKEDFDGPAFSFGFDGSLAEARERASVIPVGDWSFVVDAPLPCASRLEPPTSEVLEYCVRYDNALASEHRHPYVWKAPRGYETGRAGSEAYANSPVQPRPMAPLTTSAFFAVYRAFVNEPPTLRFLEPEHGVLYVFEDHAAYFSVVVAHKAEDMAVGRALAISIGVQHGHVRSLSQAAVVRLASGDRRTIEYRGLLHDINDFLAQVEYRPDPNYAGADLVELGLTDGEFTVNVSMPVAVSELSDPLTLVCPPTADIWEGADGVLIATNISVHDNEPLPGKRDDETEVAVEIFVGGGRLWLDAPPATHGGFANATSPEQAPETLDILARISLLLAHEDPEASVASVSLFSRTLLA